MPLVRFAEPITGTQAPFVVPELVSHNADAKEYESISHLTDILTSHSISFGRSLSIAADHGRLRTIFRDLR